MSEKLWLDRKIGFQNTFYTKCINVIIDSIGPSIILRSIYVFKLQQPSTNLSKEFFSKTSFLNFVVFLIFADFTFLVGFRTSLAITSCADVMKSS